ncbi:MAG: hypothetical protein ACYC9W_10380, partial [Candidatus Limnocylindria bacterium]
MMRFGAAAVAILLIGSACSSSFAKDNPQLCSADKVQLVKDYVAKDGLTPQAAANKAGTDARCLSANETTQAQATFAAFQAQQATATPSPSAAATTAAPSASPSASPSLSPTPSSTLTAAPAEAQATAAPTEQPAATPSPT